MKAVNIVKYLTLIIGLGMLIGAFFAYQNSKAFVQKSLSTEGKIIDLIRTTSSDSDGYISYIYYPVIEFETETGEMVTFQSNTGSNPPSYNINEPVEVFYLKENPQNAKINSFFGLWSGPFILVTIGGVSFLVGFGMIFFHQRRQKQILWLKQFGRHIQTKFKNVVHNTNYEVNGRSPYQIISQKDENGQVYVFKSDNLWFDPTSYLQKDQEITVLVDPQNMKKYWMDTSFLPELKN